MTEIAAPHEDYGNGMYYYANIFNQSINQFYLQSMT